MLAEESKPQPPQRVGAVQHHLHQTAGMGAGMEGPLQPMVNRPNAAQAPSNGHAEDEESGPADGLPDSTSTMRPNSTGSANCAPASSRLAPARIQPSLASFPSNSRTRV